MPALDRPLSVDCRGGARRGLERRRAAARGRREEAPAQGPGADAAEDPCGRERDRAEGGAPTGDRDAGAVNLGP